MVGGEERWLFLLHFLLFLACNFSFLSLCFLHCLHAVHAKYLLSHSFLLYSPLLLLIPLPSLPFLGIKRQISDIGYWVPSHLLSNNSKLKLSRLHRRNSLRIWVQGTERTVIRIPYLQEQRLTSTLKVNTKNDDNKNIRTDISSNNNCNKKTKFQIFY
jgi:hypothetical protein